MGHQHLLGKFESGYGLLTSDAREVLQEVVEGITGLQVVEQGANRNTGADEDRRPSKDVRVTVDHR
jgi:hypothetical protein